MTLFSRTNDDNDDDDDRERRKLLDEHCTTVLLIWEFPLWPLIWESPSNSLYGSHLQPLTWEWSLLPLI